MATNAQAIVTGEANDDKLFYLDLTHFQRILPAEIWQLVTGKLKKRPVNLINLTNASPYFKNLLGSQRTIFLFEPVFSILLPTIWNNEGQIGLPNKDILKCRQVCSYWNETIDKLFWEKFRFLEEPKHIIKSVQSLVRNEFKHSIDLLFKFVRHFSTTHPGGKHLTRNPLIYPPRNPHISLTTKVIEDEYNDHVNMCFMEGMSKLLDRYGTKIQRFVVKFIGNDLLPEEVDKLVEWLYKIPNTTHLLIYNETEQSASLDGLELEKPIPKLNHLRTLRTHQLPTVLFNKIMKKNDHISSLYVKQDQLDYYNLFRMTLPNLKLVHLKSVQPFQTSLIEVRWPMLEALEISFPCDTNLVTIFRMMEERFGGSSLAHLFLELPNTYGTQNQIQAWRNSIHNRLYLPNLKGLSLTLNKPLCLDFLLSMKNTLELLWLDVQYSTEEAASWKIIPTHAKVKLVGLEDRIWESEISTLFKNLVNIVVSSKTTGQTNSYSRRVN